MAGEGIANRSIHQLDAKKPRQWPRVECRHITVGVENVGLDLLEDSAKANEQKRIPAELSNQISQRYPDALDFRNVELLLAHRDDHQLYMRHLTKTFEQLDGLPLLAPDP